MEERVDRRKTPAGIVGENNEPDCWEVEITGFQLILGEFI